MATRLARWLAIPTLGLVGLDAHVGDYAASGAFVDLARVKLLGGDPIAALSAALGGLAERVSTRREAMNRAFAESFEVWNQAGSQIATAIPVEQVLDAVVAPLADAGPVLLLVIDGLSIPVFIELATDLGKLGWTLLQREEGGRGIAAISALPTITEVSRASLLAGRLTSGGQQVEKTGFAQHAALAARSRPSAPVLFHKGELGDGVGLAARVREALGAREPRVVGVVYNAIDDQLDGAMQLHLRWTIEDLRMLPAILHEARGAGRIVVVTADHGHVIERGTRQLGGGDGDRWRRPDGRLDDSEIAIEGGRVLTPGGAAGVVVPWSERVRYGAKKSGYHGGVSPQEALVPVQVLAPSGMVVPGFRPTPPIHPEWWQAAPTTIVEFSVPAGKSSAEKGARRTARSLRGPGGDRRGRLDRCALRVRRLQDPASDGGAGRSRRRRPAAAPRSARRTRRQALAGGTRGPPQAARAAGRGLPERRAPVLNVDQSAVLVVDEAADTVELNRRVLEIQFELDRR